MARSAEDQVDSTATAIRLPGGGAVATSSTTSRTWTGAAGTLHHILDPASLRPAPPVWRFVSVAADTCVDANTGSTAAVVRGRQALTLLESSGLAARLVAADGSVVHVANWPDVPPQPRFD